VGPPNRPISEDPSASTALGKEAPAWHRLSTEACTQRLEVNPAQGLSAAEVTERRRTYGPNELAAAEKEPFWRAFLRQFADYRQIISTMIHKQTAGNGIMKS
jgi:Ca2+-transporting ATPase